ncbi:MAG: DEAD/DEAH box helicase family protein [Bacteroidales bacterium]|nr:DEAD/DEAH box helicase family protein [Bacteroidales bacterium]
MKNFDFLSSIAPAKKFHEFCDEVEMNQRQKPVTSAFYGRLALEWLVQAIYKLERLPWNENDKLVTHLNSPEFISFIHDPNLLRNFDFIRRIGNLAAHGSSVSTKDSFFVLLNLHNIAGAMFKRWGFIDDIPVFDKSLIPDGVKGPVLIPAPVPAAPSQDFLGAAKPAQGAAEIPVLTEKELSEAETRKLFIDMMLREAGWEVLETKGLKAAGKACIEIEVKGMPSASGVGYVDYVLFGNNGKPVALIEAKRATKSLSVGEQQAKLYADCLEKEYGVRPVIYVSNGFETMIIDGLGYPPRNLFSFHTLEDLVFMLQKRGRKDIVDMNPNPDIAGRYYQITAVKSICEWFNKKYRRGLLVMATGTGKTRTAISLVEILKRNNWVKNVLFLADRTTLVSQAADNFVKLLPSETSCILSEDKDPDMRARIMFSTYQTMVRYIDAEDKKFSIGRFDLIIIDEAHRSVFGKYGSLFAYFDSLLIGLTATPRNQIEKSTYKLLQLDDDKPNYAYEYEQAIADKYLVPYETLVRHSKIMEAGIKYDDLTDDERKQLEKPFAYEKAKLGLNPKSDFSRDISGREIFKYLYNEDTVIKVLDDLMKNGLKVQNGDLIGKSIIFGYDHEHAELIVKLFHKRYPEYGPDFCLLVDYSVNYVKDRISDFKTPESLPQIVVSVDMLDTGVDVPEVLNLVFFKPVRSKIKFQQMIGRGTRLCPNIFGAGKHKEKFLIFDYCNNFEFFSQPQKEKSGVEGMSLTERLFHLRTDFLVGLQEAKYQMDPFCKELHGSIKKTLLEQVQSLNENRIEVRMHWETVFRYKQEENWQTVTPIQATAIKNELGPILPRPMEDGAAKLFDALMLQLQLSMVDSLVSPGKCQKKVIDVAAALEKKATIPEVLEHMPTIQYVQTSAFWQNISVESLENVRVELRDLIHYIMEGSDHQTFVIDIEDLIEEGEAKVLIQSTYRQRVLDYLQENRDYASIRKIYSLEQLTRADLVELEHIFWTELGSKEEYDELVSGKKYGTIAAFIRSIIDIDRDRAMEKYKLLQKDSAMTSQQELYLKGILDYVSTNGDIERQSIAEDPLRGYNWTGAFGIQLQNVVKFVDQLHNVIRPSQGYNVSDQDYLKAAEA